MRLWSEFLLDEKLVEVHAEEMRKIEKRRGKKNARDESGGGGGGGGGKVTGPTMRVLLEQLIRQYRMRKENVGRMSGNAAAPAGGGGAAAFRDVAMSERDARGVHGDDDDVVMEEEHVLASHNSETGDNDHDDGDNAAASAPDGSTNAAATATPPATVDTGENESSQYKDDTPETKHAQQRMLKRLLKSLRSLIVQTARILLSENALCVGGDTKTHEKRSGVGGGIKSLETLRCLVPAALLADLIQIFAIAAREETSQDDDNDGDDDRNEKVDANAMGVAGAHLQVEQALQNYMEMALPECGREMNADAAASVMAHGALSQHENIMMMVGNSPTAGNATDAANPRTRLPKVPPIAAMEWLSNFIVSYDGIASAHIGGHSSPDDADRASDVGLAAADLAELFLASGQPEKAGTILDGAAKCARAASLPLLERRVESLRNATSFLLHSERYYDDDDDDDDTTNGEAKRLRPEMLLDARGDVRGTLALDIEKAICNKEWDNMIHLLRKSVAFVASSSSAAKDTSASRDEVLSMSHRFSLADDFRLPAGTIVRIEVSNVVYMVVTGTWSPDRAAMEFVDLCHRGRLRAVQGNGDELHKEELHESTRVVNESGASSSSSSSSSIDNAKKRIRAMIDWVAQLESTRDAVSFVTWSPFVVGDNEHDRRSGKETDTLTSTQTTTTTTTSSSLSYGAVQRNLDALAFGANEKDIANLDVNVKKLNQRLIDSSVDDALCFRNDTANASIVRTLERGLHVCEDKESGGDTSTTMKAMYMLSSAFTRAKDAEDAQREKKRKLDDLKYDQRSRNEGYPGFSGSAEMPQQHEQEATEERPQSSSLRAVEGDDGDQKDDATSALPISIESDEISTVRFAAMCITSRTWSSHYKQKMLEIIVQSHVATSGGAARGATATTVRSMHKKTKFLTTLMNCCDCLERCLEFAELIQSDQERIAVSLVKASKNLSTLYRILSSHSLRDGEVTMLARVIAHLFSYSDLSLLVAVISGLVYKTSLLQEQYQASRDIRFASKVGMGVVKHMNWSDIEGTNAESRLRCVQPILEIVVARMKICMSRCDSGIALGDASMLCQLALAEGDIESARGNNDAAARQYTAACAINCRFGHGDIKDAFSKDIGRRALLSIASSACKRGKALSAAALCQCTSPVDFAAAFSFLQDRDRTMESGGAAGGGGGLGSALATTDIELAYLSCLWELPIFERIVYAFNNESRSLKRRAHVHAALEELQSPGLNLYNTVQRSTAIAGRKRRLVMLIMRDALSTLCSDTIQSQKVMKHFLQQ